MTVTFPNRRPAELSPLSKSGVKKEEPAPCLSQGTGPRRKLSNAARLAGGFAGDALDVEAGEAQIGEIAVG
jgi:hypothetical protein